MIATGLLIGFRLTSEPQATVIASCFLDEVPPGEVTRNAGRFGSRPYAAALGLSPDQMPEYDWRVIDLDPDLIKLANSPEHYSNITQLPSEHGISQAYGKIEEPQANCPHPEWCATSHPYGISVGGSGVGDDRVAAIARRVYDADEVIVSTGNGDLEGISRGERFLVRVGLNGKNSTFLFTRSRNDASPIKTAYRSAMLTHLIASIASCESEKG